MTNRYGGSSSYTVQHVLNQMDDTAEMIEDLNTNGINHYNLPTPETQEAANYQMRNYIDAIAAYLSWNGLDENGVALPPNIQPDVAGYTGSKTAYTTAMALGEAYITENT